LCESRETKGNATPQKGAERRRRSTTKKNSLVVAETNVQVHKRGRFWPGRERDSGSETRAKDISKRGYLPQDVLPLAGKSIRSGEVSLALPPWQGKERRTGHQRGEGKEKKKEQPIRGAQDR